MIHSYNEKDVTKKLLLFILLTNIVLYGISFSLGLERPIINIDYVLIYLAFLVISYHKWLKVPAIAFMLALSGIDILLLVNQIFHLFSWVIYFI